MVKSIEKCYDWKKGDYCIVNYHLDRKWYRGKVEEILDKQTLQVNKMHVSQ
jgi:hypothetical protein